LTFSTGFGGLRKAPDQSQALLVGTTSGLSAGEYHYVLGQVTKLKQFKDISFNQKLKEF